MKINVTNEDIERGQQSDPHACAVARAMGRAGLDHFGVMGSSVMVADPSGNLVSSLLPPKVRAWISDFDAGKLVTPFTFELASLGPAQSGRCASADADSFLSSVPPSPRLYSHLIWEFVTRQPG